MATYLVTGGAGFIGANLVAALLREGHQVRVLDNFSTGRRSNLAPFLSQIDVIEGDLRSYHLVREAVAGVDYVLHHGALPSVQRSVRDPITTNEVNVAGTLNILQAARDANVLRLVYASSSSVYGNGAELPKHEGQRPDPLSPYAISKLAGEQYCQSFWRLYGFSTICLRYFNVFGPRQNPTSTYAAVIPRFVAAMLKGEPVTIHGNGLQSRDFTFVDNVVAANLLACKSPNVSGQIMNIACGERHSLLDLLDSLSKIIGVKPEIRFMPPQPGDVMHSLADVSRAQESLGYQTLVRLPEGLEQTVAWFRENGHE